MDDIVGEVWKDIEGWPYHQVSNKGRVRALPGATLNGWRVATEIEIKNLAVYRGYVVVRRGIKAIQVRVHRLVLTAFVGPCPPGKQCRHLNGDKSNNRLENLEWGTPKENGEDKVKHGTAVRGDLHYRAKITDSQVTEIRASHDTQWELARRYGISQGSVSRILRGTQRVL